MIVREIPPYRYREYLCQSLYGSKREPSTLLEHVAYGNYAVDQMRKDIADGADVNQRDDFGRVPLMVCGHSCYIDVLLENHADCTAVDHAGNTVLMYQRCAYEKILSRGANINARNKNGDTLFDFLIREHEDIEPFLKLGLKWGRIPAEFLGPAFLNMARLGELHLMKKSVKDGFPSERFALLSEMVALTGNKEKMFAWVHESLFEKMFSKNAPFLLSQEEIGEFKWSVDSAINGNRSKMLDDFLSDFSDYLGTIPIDIQEQSLLNAVDHETSECLQILLKHGFCLKKDSAISDGIPPLMKAVYKNNVDLVKILLSHGANPTTGTIGMDSDDTGIAVAIRQNQLEILRLLIGAGADLNFAIRCNRTPVITAITYNNVVALKMLVDSGADVNRKDKFGRMPKDYIRKDTSEEIKEYFSVN